MRSIRESQNIGYKFAGPDETVKIFKGVVVHSEEYAVSSKWAGSELLNYGTISGDVIGVDFGAYSSAGEWSVYNFKKATIEGHAVGIMITGELVVAHIENSGLVRGNKGIFVHTDSGATIWNDGDIEGQETGVWVAAYAESPPAAFKITNSGTIFGGEKGISAPEDDFLLFVGNEKGGKIISPEWSVRSFADTTLNNKGKIDGDIFLWNFDDILINSGKIKGDISLAGGDDVLKIKGGSISGLLDSGFGNDRLSLGEKVDRVAFTSDLDASANVDIIKGFRSGKDKMYLDQDIFDALEIGALSSSEFRIGNAAGDADDRIIYDRKSGDLYYDVDGAGGAGQVLFARLTGSNKLKASDFVVGRYALDDPDL